jgi:DNA phosphorothioation-dependent restriction protein DptG
MFRLKKTASFYLLILFSMAFSFETIEFFAKTMNDDGTVNVADYQTSEKCPESKKSEGKEKGVDFLDDLFLHDHEASLPVSAPKAFLEQVTIHFSSSDHSAVITPPPDRA